MEDIYQPMASLVWDFPRGEVSEVDGHFVIKFGCKMAIVHEAGMVKAAIVDLLEAELARMEEYRKELQERKRSEPDKTEIMGTAATDGPSSG